MTHSTLKDKFDHVVLIDPEYRDDPQVLNWLWDNIASNTFHILYTHYTPADGKWRHGPEYVIWGAAFKYEVDATAFKLRWA